MRPLYEIPKIIPRQFMNARRLFLTSDEHYDHERIIMLCHRPFRSVDEMNREIVKRHNSIVRDTDVTIHIGDTFLGKYPEVMLQRIDQLNGTHFFMDGNHDHWLRKLDGAWYTKYLLPKLFEFTYDGAPITLCHHAVARFNKSHYPGSYHFFGHSHGTYDATNCAIDIGVDCHEFYPVSIERAIEMASQKQADIPSRDGHGTESNHE